MVQGLAWGKACDVGKLLHAILVELTLCAALLELVGYVGAVVEFGSSLIRSWAYVR